MEVQAHVARCNGKTLLHRNNKVIPLIEPKEYLDNLDQARSIKGTYLSGAAMNIIVFEYEGRD